MFLHYSPFWLKAFFPRYIWRIPTDEKSLFLTFDDGPIPDVTEYVLDKLDEFNAKATFFCIGDNVRKHPDIFANILDRNHSVGNHTFNHLNGWKSEDQVYLENIKLCDNQLAVTTKLFRPPYGRMKKSQTKLIPSDRKIIMWDVLSGDFSPGISPDVCLKKTIKHTRQGSIILFHDSIKAAKNMTYALPRVLEHFSEKGFSFKSLPMN
jgi:peptidoglycan/xylan/chitin deacetylase (PgdA/CDA1 family)